MLPHFYLDLRLIGPIKVFQPFRTDCHLDHHRETRVGITTHADEELFLWFKQTSCTGITKLVKETIYTCSLRVRVATGSVSG